MNSSLGMSRKFNFWNYSYMMFFGKGNNFFNLLLGVKPAIGLAINVRINLI